MNDTRKTLPLLLLLASSLLCRGQEIMGRDFWVAFIPSFFASYPDWYQSHPDAIDDYYLLATSSKHCWGTVSNPNTGWSGTFSVSPQRPCRIDVPFGEAFPNPGVNNAGIHVWASDTVSLFAFTEYTRPYDEYVSQCGATLVIPTNKLGDEYVVQTAPALLFDKAAVSVLATQDGTVVDILASCDAANSGPAANTPFSVSLDAGQAYYFKTSLAQTAADFTGTTVKSRDGKPIAVFSGNLMQCNVNDQYWVDYRDMLMEQTPPARCGGRTFVVAGALEYRQDSVRVTALRDKCVVYRNGNAVDTLTKGQTHKHRIPDGTEAELVTTSQPAIATLCNTYRSYDEWVETHRGMAVIDPMEQGVRKAVFPTIDNPSANSHYVNVTLRTEHKDAMTLDGESIASRFKPVPHAEAYSYAKISIEPGQHTLANSAGPFTAQAYGGRKWSNESYEYTGYAHSAGSMMHDLSAQILADGVFSTDFPGGMFFCEGHAPVFSLHADFPVTSASWDFGDGATAEGLSVEHLFPSPGDYAVACDAYDASAGPDSLAVSLRATVHIQQPAASDTWRTACDAYDWNGLHCTQPGDHAVTLATVGGCDSVATLHLTLHRSDTVHYEAEACGQYLWRDSLYTASGRHEHYEGENRFGCDSVAVLHLAVLHDPPFEVKGITQVAFATDIWPGVYYYHVADSALFDGGAVAWECSNPEWVVTPLSGFTCMVFVRTPGQATLTAVSPLCQSAASLPLNATPFGVGEHPDGGVSLFPNPANNSVTVAAEGIRHVEICNLLGQKVATLDGDDPESVTIGLSGLARGVYLVKVWDMEGRCSAGKLELY